MGGQGLGISLCWRRHFDHELCGSKDKCWPFPQTKMWELLVLVWGRRVLVHGFYHIGNCWYLSSVCRNVCYPEIIKLLLYVASDAVLYNV